MSEEKKDSNAHPAVREFREKLESIAEHQLPELQKINERLGKLTTPVPPKEELEEEPVPSTEPVPRTKEGSA